MRGLMQLLFLLLSFSFINAQSLLPIGQLESIVLKEFRENNMEHAKMILRSQSFSKKSSIAHYYLQQQVHNIPIHNAYLDLHLNSEQKVVRLHHSFFKKVEEKIQNQHFQISAEQALYSAIRHLRLPLNEIPQLLKKENHQYTFTAKSISLEDIQLHAIWYPKNQEELIPAWKLSILELSAKHRWDLIIDATSTNLLEKRDAVLHCSFGHHTSEHCRQSLTSSKEYTTTCHSSFTEEGECQYRVFPHPTENPYDGERVLVSDPFDSEASPFGWHDTNGIDGHEYTITKGNNVFAKTDDTGFNGDGFSPDGGEEMLFDFPLNLDESPETYRAAAVTNLFYWCNFMHDLAYEHGFDEAAGNFQHNNYGKGGVQEDFIIADAQDQGDRNNANFSCGPDGSKGRIQMYLWDNPAAGLHFYVSDQDSQSFYNAVQAQFGAVLSPSTVEGPIVLSSMEPNLACNPINNNLTGKIALIERGSCLFVDKVYHAQSAGAIACIICQNSTDDPFAMGGENDAIQIPSIMISKSDCEIIKQQLEQSTLIAQMYHDPNEHSIDSDLDNAVIAHEYAHGISIRLIGGAEVVNCLNNAEQMGEGWSDFFGLITTIKEEDLPHTARTIGRFLLVQTMGGSGLRPTPYSTDLSINPATYADLNASSSVHHIGYIWASILWDICWAFIKEYGLEEGKSMVLDLVIEGMKFMPCNPGFVEARDAIFDADQALFDGQHETILWKAFAKRGLGYSADQGSSHNKSDGIAAFDYPPCMFPNAYCQDREVYLSTVGGAFLSATVLNNNSTDCNGELSFSINDQAFVYLDCADLGIKEVTLEVKNTLGAVSTCISQINVIDTIAPMAICLPLEVDLSSPTITADQLAGYSIDNCTPKENLSYNFESITFSEDDLGKNQLEIMVEDASGNIDSCLAVVNVIQQVPANFASDHTEKSHDQSLRFSPKMDVTIFPNPADEWLQIYFPTPIKDGSIIIYNSNGQIVLQSILPGDTPLSRLNTRHLSSGIYFLKFEYDHAQITQKIVIH